VTLIEIILNFFRVEVNAIEEKSTIKFTSIKYLKGWFLIDILGNIHLELYSAHILMGVKLIRFRQVIRSSSTVQRGITLCSSYLFSNSININLGKIFGKVTQLIIFLIVVGHMLSLLVMTAQFNFIFLVYEKVKENGKGEDPKFTVYIACLHFITTTITTVGYGENNITNALP
jgi:CRP-like cAMP-binding protein